MKILTVASEATPFAKTGGLADVLGSLPAALAQRGAEVAVVLPLYRRSAVDLLAASTPVLDGLPVHFTQGRAVTISIRRLDHRGVTHYFVDCPEYFDRAGLYGDGGVDYPDNHLRFGALCRGAMAIIRSVFRPDVVHCHDWQASLIAAIIQDRFRADPTFRRIPLLLTVHNLGYQGLFPRTAIEDLGLSPSLFRPDALEFHGRVNLLKGGLVFADAISTVSPTYAREIQTPEYGMGLDGLLRSRAHVLTGIVNGVDYAEWNPETDEHLPAHYSAADLSGKAECKRALLQEGGLAQNAGRPLIGIVGRIVGQKGFDLIDAAADRLFTQHDVAMVALGTGEPVYQTAMASLAARYPDRVHVRIAYDNGLAHRIEAGADLFLMPSRYEPCGLNQIYSLRYGTVPVVRATGGLEDTVDEDAGFRFHEYSPDALLVALGRALSAYQDTESWRNRVLTCMSRDWSWHASADRYMDLFRQLTTPA
ncbi:MAG TPA: glycogen synthase GlgA [Bryobacteraceae bacterium]|nr:glycogen synthase GlgA [Bryobacteraceae bacterium]